jgi:hypothetical protein
LYLCECQSGNKGKSTQASIAEVADAVICWIILNTHCVIIANMWQEFSCPNKIQESQYVTHYVKRRVIPLDDTSSSLRSSQFDLSLLNDIHPFLSVLGFPTLSLKFLLFWDSPRHIPTILLLSFQLSFFPLVLYLIQS